MITRTAIFEGRIKPGFGQRYMDEVRNRLRPIWRGERPTGPPTVIAVPRLP